MKKISFGAQTIQKDDVKSVVKTLNSKFLTQGSKTIELEKKISSYLKAMLTASSGTAGLHLACMALGISKKD